ncbi:O-antigen ligase family protein, partial [Patescibacteria group bacterium]
RNIFNKPNILFVSLIIFGLLATIFSEVWIRSLDKLIYYFGFLVYFIAAQVLTDINKASFKRFLVNSILYSSIVLSLISFYFFFLKIKPPFSSMNLVYANFGHNHIIDLLIIALPLSLVLLLTESEIKKKIFFLLVNVILLAGFILSYSRGGLFMGIIILYILTYSLRKKKIIISKRKNLILSLFTAVIITVLSISLISSLVTPKLKSFTERNNSSLLDKFCRETTLDTRFAYWTQGFMGLKEKPIFGWGLDNFRYVSKMFQKLPGYWSWYTHNHFFQIFAETGIFGGLAFLTLIFFMATFLVKNIFYQRNFKVKESSAINMALSVGALGSIIHSFFDYDWQFSSIFLLFWIIVGYLYAYSQNSHESNLNKAGKKEIKTKIIKKNIDYKVYAILFIGFCLFVISVLQFQASLLILYGSRESKNNNINKAENYFKKGLKFWPFSLKNHYQLAEFYKEHGNDDKYLQALNNLITLEPIYYLNHVLLGDFYRKRAINEKSTNMAINAYYEGIKLNPSDSVNIYIKIIDLIKNDMSRTQELFTIIQKIENLKGKKCLLRCIGSDNEKKIEVTLSQLIKSDNFSTLNQDQKAKIYYWLAILTIHEKKWNQEIDLLKKAVDLDKKQEYIDFYNNLTLIKEIESLYAKENYSKVKQLSAPLIKKEKNHLFFEKWYVADVFYYLGSIELNWENYEMAETYFLKSIEINPWNDKPYLSLVKIYEFRSDDDLVNGTINKCFENNRSSRDCQNKL